MAGWGDVVAAGRELPGVEEGTWFRTPALKVRGKSFCRMRGDDRTLVVRVLDLDDKEALLRGNPQWCSTTPHYDGYAFVLVDLARVPDETLRELVEDAWRLTAPRGLLEARDGG